MPTNIRASSYSLFPDGTKTELALDFSPQGWWFDLEKFNPILIEWCTNNINNAKLVTGKVLGIFDSLEAYTFKDPLGELGANVVIRGDVDSLGIIYSSPSKSISYEYYADLASNTIVHTRAALGWSEYIVFTDFLSMYPNGIDPRGISFSIPVNMFSIANKWHGSNLDDKLYGYAGADSIFGNAGDDIIAGGLDNDSLVGNSGNDIVFGEEGDDRIWGSAGNDTLIGADGDDKICGGTGEDGTQTLGQDGDDKIYGEGGNDSLWGEDGKDIIYGGIGNDYIHGGFENDELYGGDGNDLIRGGNGADVITGGAGKDELHGDFGSNTYKSDKDGFSDLIAIKSDHYLSNWYFGKSGNNTNGEKCDLIESLETIDRIKIIGVTTNEITFAANISAKSKTGVGIIAKGALEALYIGGDLSVSQLRSMTSGDASAAAMSNSVNSYGTW